MVKVPLLALPQLGSCASSGRAWRPWAARHSKKEAGQLDAQPLPRLPEPAASNVTDSAAFDHVGATLGKTSAMDALAQSVQQQAQESGLLTPVPQKTAT